MSPVLAADPPYVYRPPGKFGVTPPTREEMREAFASAPACHHDHGLVARQASQFLAGREKDMAARKHQPGDIQLVRMGGTGGRVIRVLQFVYDGEWADYEHARLLVEVTGPNEGLFFEAQPGGAVLAKHELDGDGRFWSSGILKPKPTQRAGMTMIARMYAEEKVPYSWVDYAALAARRLGLKSAPVIRDYVKSTGHMICSQAVARIWFEAGCPLFDRWTGYVSPSDIYKLLKEKSGA